MTALLPCPFCGSAPKVVPENPEIEGNAWGGVSCVSSDCYAAPSVEIYDLSPRGEPYTSTDYKDAATFAWNIRKGART